VMEQLLSVTRRSKNNDSLAFMLHPFQKERPVNSTNVLKTHRNWAARIVPAKPSPDISRLTCCDHGYGRPSWRPRVSVPATYRSGTPRDQSRGTAGRVTRWPAPLSPASGFPVSGSRDSNS
jgi:hypothetical protein